LENNIIPALRAGFIVLADRYIYTLMARDILRGSDPGCCRRSIPWPWFRTRCSI